MLSKIKNLCFKTFQCGFVVHFTERHCLVLEYLKIFIKKKVVLENLKMPRVSSNIELWTTLPFKFTCS